MRISDWSSDVCSSDLRGHVAKLRFAHPGAENPPTFIVHGTRLKTLSETYRRYLENFFRKRFKLVGTPVRFVFKEGENPYKDRKNVLSERQVAKKKRLIRHAKRGKWRTGRRFSAADRKSTRLNSSP